MYGCSNRGDASLKLHERVFPLMMSKNASNKVNSQFCSSEAMLTQQYQSAAEAVFIAWNLLVHTQIFNFNMFPLVLFQEL